MAYKKYIDWEKETLKKVVKAPWLTESTKKIFIFFYSVYHYIQKKPFSLLQTEVANYSGFSPATISLAIKQLIKYHFLVFLKIKKQRIYFPSYLSLIKTGFQKKLFFINDSSFRYLKPKEVPYLNFNFLRVTFRFPKNNLKSRNLKTDMIQISRIGSIKRNSNPHFFRYIDQYLNNHQKDDLSTT